MRTSTNQSLTKTQRFALIGGIVTVLGFILFQTGALGDATINFSLRGFFAGENGLVAYYTFDGESFDISSSTAEVRDASGNGYNGNIVNNASTTDAIIDSTNLSATSTSFLNTSPAVVFTSKQDGYVFYVDTDPTTRAGPCVMASTTDGGVTWSAPQTVDTVNTIDCMRISVWYDGWTQTPAVAGTTSTTTKIHILTSDISVDDMYYTYLAFSTTTGIPRLSTTALTQTQGSSNAANTNFQSITRTATGTLFASFHDATDRYVLACSYNCETSANWTEISTTNYLSTVGDDWPILVPVPGTNNMMQIYNDISANYKSQIFSGTSSAWWATTSAMTMYITGAITENATYDATIGATVDWNNNKIYTAWANDNNDFSTQDHDLLFGSFSTDTWAWSTSTVASNIASRGISDVKISYDHINDLIYLVYAAGSMSTSTTRVYYRTSADNGGTWSAEQGPVDDTAYDKWGGANVPIMGENIYNFSLGSSTPASSTVQGRSVSAPFANYAFSEGRVGQGYEFDGVDDYVDLGSEATFDNMTEGTVALWVRPYGSSTVAQALISKDNSGNNNGDFTLVVNDSDDTSDVNKFQFQLTDDVPSTQIIASNNEVSFNGWQHLAITWGSGGMQMWVNGVLQTETLPAVTAGVDNASATLVLGAGLGGTSTFFDGVLDDVRIYNRALSADDITRIYKVGGTTKINQTLEVPNTAKSSLLGHWTFDGKDTTFSSTTSAVPAYDNDTLYDASGANTTHTFTHTINSIANGGVMLVGAAMANDPTVVTGITANGVSMTHIRSDGGSAAIGELSWWYFVPTTTGSVSISVSLDASEEITADAISFTGVNQADPIDADAGTTGSSITATINITPTVANTMIVSQVLDETTDNTATPQAGITEQWETGNLAGFDDVHAGGNESSNAAGATSSVWTLGASADNFAASAVALAPATIAVSVRNLGSAGGYLIAGFPDPLAQGRIGQGASINLEGQFYRTTSNTISVANSSFSLGGWMQLSPESMRDGQHDFIFIQDDGDDATGVLDKTLHLGIRGSGANSGKVIFGFFNDDLHSISNRYSSSTEWIHVFGTYNVSTNERIIYVNGVQETSDTATGDYSGTGTICISRCNFQPLSGQYMDGKVDDVRLYNRVLTAQEVNDIYKLGATSKLNTTVDTPSPLKSSLVAHWTFDGSEVNLTQNTAEIRDRSANASHGDWIDHASTTAPGRIGQAIQFDGTNDYVNAGSLSALDNLGRTTPMSVSAWIYPNTDGEGDGTYGAVIVTKGTGDGWWLSLSENPVNALRWTYGCGGTSLFKTSAANSITNRQWQHVVVTTDGSVTAANTKIYVNGVEQSYFESISCGASLDDDSPWNVLIGGSEGVSTFDGKIDDVRLYSKVLSSSEIQELYQMGQ